eukprot:Phypoly_transcript_14808.p1 GENE.Phypoly_transcript_14808~~Phypoly_transcript_14808.p1  ORF type:complete len:169 (+),score=6.26 Phypoly_transcript_14808:2-508(+)
MRKKGVVQGGRRSTPTKPQVGEMLDSITEDVKIFLEQFQSFKFANYAVCGCLNLALLISLSSSTKPYYPGHIYLSDLFSASFSYLLLLGSVANAFMFFSRKKTYHLTRFDPAEISRSRNLKPTMINIMDDENNSILSAVEVVELKIWNPGIYSQHDLSMTLQSSNTYI